MDIQELEAFSPQGNLYPVQNQLHQHIARRSLAAFARGDADRDAIQTVEQWQQRRSQVRQQLLDAMGGLPEGGDLNAQVTGRESLDGITIEKLMFESRPGCPVTANLYLPQDVSQPTAAVLFLCGHHSEAKTVGEYQAVCQTFARNGLVVLAQDPPGQGERLDYVDPETGKSRIAWGTFEHDYAGAQCKVLGQNVARYFIHDAMRGIDYLASRAEVDADRIAVTGNSGGGTQTALMMMLEPRLAAAAPGTFIMNRETYFHTGQPQDAEQIWQGFTAAGFDHEDILLAMADRPVCVLAVTWDFFPIEGARRTVERSRRLFDMAGGTLELAEDDSRHSYTPKLAQDTARFFLRHLAGQRDVQLDETPPQILDHARLWATPQGQVRTFRPDSRGVYDESRTTLEAMDPPKSSAAKWLEQCVHNHRQPCELNPRLTLDGCFEDFQYEVLWWFSQTDLTNMAVVFHAAGGPAPRAEVVLALWDDGTRSLQPHVGWILSQTRAGRSVVVLDVTGHGALMQSDLLGGSRNPHMFYAAIHRCASDLYFLDDSLAALRTYDVTRALDLIQQWPSIKDRPVVGYGRGRAAVYLRLAAIIDPRLTLEDVQGGIEDYRDVVRHRYYDSFDIHSQIFHGCAALGDLSPAGSTGA